MNELYYIEQTNFDVSEIIYNIIVNDSIYFNFIKNGNANISGFLNALIPNLALYRETLHSDFLKNNQNDKEITKLIERNIYNIYLKTFDLTDDSKHNIQLRINKENKEAFMNIQDIYLAKYDMTFSTYIKSLLYEYASRPLFQREMLFILKSKKELLKAIKQSKFINIRFNNNSRHKVLAVDIAVSPSTNENYIFGFSENKDMLIVKLSSICNIISTNEKLTLSDEDYENISNLEYDFFNNRIQELKGDI